MPSDLVIVELIRKHRDIKLSSGGCVPVYSFYKQEKIKKNAIFHSLKLAEGQVKTIARHV
jgi:hypothetical protein